MVMCLYYSMLPVKNTFMYLAIMCQPVEDGSYKASYVLIVKRQLIQCLLNIELQCMSLDDIIISYYTIDRHTDSCR